MQELAGILVLSFFVASFTRWLFLHWRFRSILREEKPELARKLRGIGISYSSGSEWIDFALEKKYRNLGSERLEIAGDALVNAYGKFQVSWVLIWFFGSILFGVVLLLH